MTARQKCDRPQPVSGPVLQVISSSLPEDQAREAELSLPVSLRTCLSGARRRRRSSRRPLITAWLKSAVSPLAKRDPVLRAACMESATTAPISLIMATTVVVYAVGALPLAPTAGSSGRPPFRWVLRPCGGAANRPGVGSPADAWRSRLRMAVRPSGAGLILSSQDAYDHGLDARPSQGDGQERRGRR